MSRALAYSAILILLLLLAVVGGRLARENGGAENSGPEFGEGYEYQTATLARFRTLLEQMGWRIARPPRNPQGMLETVHEKTGLTFVLIPEGTLSLRILPGTGLPPELERVHVFPFLLCRSECTQRAWDRLRVPDSRRWRSDDLPIDGASWSEVETWCEEAQLRLPSLHEWQFALSAGSVLERSFPHNLAQLEELAWVRTNSQAKTHPVESKLPNEWGLYDMLGNLSEYCIDGPLQSHALGSWNDDLRPYAPSGAESFGVTTARTREFLATHGFRPACSLK